MSTSAAQKVRRPYHHGNLRDALVEAALAAARAHGPDAVVLRAATRAAGVSPNAAYRHFADREDLLREVAARCRERMAALMETRLAEVDSRPGPDGAGDRLRSVGRSYVEFALAEPGWFRTAFAPPLTGSPNEAGHDHLFNILTRALDDLVTAHAMPAASRPGAEYVAWSAVHGIATLLTDGPLRNLPGSERHAAIERVINAVAFSVNPRKARLARSHARAS